MTRRIAFALTFGFLALHSSPENCIDAAPPTDAKETAIDVGDATTDARAFVKPTPAAAERAGVVVIVKGGPAGDFAFAKTCTPKLTVGDAVKGGAWPQPIDFAASQISVYRTRTIVNDNLTVEVEERVFPVTWDAKESKPTKKTNLQLEPGDRVVVTLPNAQPIPADASAPIVARQYYGPAPIAVAPPILAATPHPYSADAEPIHRYSAIPAAVPSPFSNDPVDAIPHFVAVPNADAVRATPLKSGGVTPVMAIEPQPARPSTVRFDIAVVEDLDDSFIEFDELRSPMPFMLADSATIRGTLRILKKHEHLRQISSPRLMAVAGERAQFSINNAIAKQKESDADFRQALAVEVSARELGGGLAVEFRLRNSNEGNVNEIATSLIVPHGQSVVMKTGASQVPAKDGDAAKNEASHAVYVVLTPELVR